MQAVAEARHVEARRCAAAEIGRLPPSITHLHGEKLDTTNHSRKVQKQRRLDYSMTRARVLPSDSAKRSRSSTPETDVLTEILGTDSDGDETDEQCTSPAISLTTKNQQG